MVWVFFHFTILIHSLLSRPVVFVFHMKEEEWPIFEKYILSPDHFKLCARRVTLLAYISQPDSFFHDNFPINIIRNIGIRHATTSHFILLDMDILISSNAYYDMIALPKYILRNPKSAAILPVFFSSTSLPERMQSESLEMQLQSILLDVPQALPDLRLCRTQHQCKEKKGKLWTHVGGGGNTRVVIPSLFTIHSCHSNNQVYRCHNLFLELC